MRANAPVIVQAVPVIAAAAVITQIDQHHKSYISPNMTKTALHQDNVTKLRKAGSRRNAGPSFFITFFKGTLDK